jgi:hypothetical protein
MDTNFLGPVWRKSRCASAHATPMQRRAHAREQRGRPRDSSFCRFLLSQQICTRGAGRGLQLRTCVTRN